MLVGRNGISASSFGKQPAWCPSKCTCSESDLSAICRFLMFEVIPPELPKFLRILDLTKNNIKEISNNTFVNLHNLTQLTLSNNTIVNIEEDAFKGLKNLKELCLEGNELSIETLETSTNLRGFDSLEYIDLELNQIKEIPKEMFEDLSKLRTLILMNNQL
ncbi:hypothetical protein CAPTEDRAFT_134074, partial [Capitella teleta]